MTTKTYAGCTISLSWDDQDCAPAGWYAEIHDSESDRLIAHTEQVACLVDVEEYGQDQRDDVLNALCAAYGATER